MKECKHNWIPNESNTQAGEYSYKCLRCEESISSKINKGK